MEGDASHLPPGWWWGIRQEQEGYSRSLKGERPRVCFQTRLFDEQQNIRVNPICKTEKETQMYRTVFWTLWEKARVGCFKRTASKHVYYLGWNRSPAQVGCLRQALGPGALGRPRGIRWRGRWDGGSGWGTHVNPWLIHFNVWQNPLQ